MSLFTQQEHHMRPNENWVSTGRISGTKQPVCNTEGYYNNYTNSQLLLMEAGILDCV